MRAEERQEMLATLSSGLEALVDAVRGVSEETARRSPGPDRWSILQCLEHVAIVEDYLFRQIEIATAGEPVVNERREKAIRERAPDRSRAISAPQEARPGGKFTSMAEAMAHFLASRARTVAFVESCCQDLRAQATTHPIIGVVNGYETLLMLAAHPLRHAKQIAEIRAATDRP